MSVGVGKAPELQLNENRGESVEQLKYPIVRRDEGIINNYHGIEVPNPYEYLEDSTNPETKKFIQDQNATCEAFLAKSTKKVLIERKLKEMWKYKRIGVPMIKGVRTFQWVATGSQEKSVLWVTELGRAEPRKLLDPNLFGDNITVTDIGLSDNGRYVAYTISENGSDWTVVKVRDVDCGHDLDDNIRFTKLTSLTWTKDGQGFFYHRYPKPSSGSEAKGTNSGLNVGSKIYYHAIGSLQDDDVLAVEFPEHPNWTIFTEISDDGKYLFVYASSVIREYYLFVATLDNAAVTSQLQLKQIFSTPGSHWYLANDGPTIYLMTSVGANNNHQVVRFNLESHEEQYEVVVADQGKKIHSAIVVNQNKLVICYLKDVLCRLEVRDLKTGNSIEQIPIEPGNVSSIYGRRSDTEFFFKLESYVNPGTIYKVEFSTRTAAFMQIHEVCEVGYDLSAFQMSTFSYSSNDGTNIPLFLIHKKSMALDSNRPCLLTAYGGYGTVLMPTFNAAYLFFASHFDGVVAIANIRGGGEYGQSWWDDGRLLKKGNCWDDLISGAKFLFNNNYTRPKKLAITGASNGGLLIGAVVNQRPDLFGAAIPIVGIMDMLRYHKFTLGHLWIGEFGSPEDYQYFQCLRQYSPLHNIRSPEPQGQYPAVFVLTSDHDDRVVPAHSYKFAAELQHMASTNPKQTNPLLLKVYHNAGHGMGRTTSEKIQQWTDIFTFLKLTLDYKFHF